jgi:hypothetical protein
MTGKIVDLTTKGAVAGATVQAGTSGPSATTDAKGGYSLTIDAKPFNMIVSKTGYYRLIEQETLITASVDRGSTSFVSEGTVSQLQLLLEGFDYTKGIVTIGIVPLTCPSEAGATVDWTPHVDGGAAVVRYFQGGLPNRFATSVEKGSYPSSAVVYNLEPNTAFTFTVTPPSGCTVSPFPNTYQGIQYTSASITPPGGKSFGFIRLFLNKG